MKRIIRLCLLILFVFVLVSCKNSGNDNSSQSGYKPVIYEENGKKFVNFGRYPQTLVDDENIISALSTITTTNELGYIEYNGEEYKKITAKPYDYKYTFNNGNRIKENNIYYFKVEPIKWRIIHAHIQRYTLISEMLLDNTNFYHDENEIRTVNETTIYPNNYKYSNVRAWLNGYDGSSYNVDNYTNKGFYDIVFNETEKQFIQTTLVDNSVEPLGMFNNPYTCEDTNDKLYILSQKEATSESFGFISYSGMSETREALTTDYARSKYCGINMDSSYYGNGAWWLRTPDFIYNDNMWIVNYAGYASTQTLVNKAYMAVRPVMTITL